MGRCAGQGITDYSIGKEYTFLQKTSSKGTQEKYYKDSYWYKVDRCGNEGVAEFLASLVLECSSVDDFVKYDVCTINGRSGCRSANFLHNGEEFFTFQNIYSLYYGGSLINRISEYQEVERRIDFVIGFINRVTGVDVSGYLSRVLSLDMLLLNEDRHFHNLGVIRSESGYKAAPIFDNGYSLLCDYSRYPLFLKEYELEEKTTEATAYPFCGNFELQAVAAGFGLKIDYSNLFSKLSEVSHSREKSVLQYQLKRYQKIFQI